MSRALARLIGHRWFERGKRGWEWRLSWAEITGDRPGLSFALCSFEDHYSLHVHLLWPNIFVKLPFPERWHREPKGGMDCWGVSVCSDTWSAVHFNWGRRCKIVHMPWDWDHVSHMVWLSDPISPWVSPAKHEYTPPFTDGRHVETHRYTYTLRNGAIQQRTATIYGERREWRWRWFKFLPWPRLVKRSISVQFDDEVGERSGSWKGGTIGCGYEWREGETMLAALRRMETERKFT